MTKTHPDETCELLVKVTPCTVEVYLSVDGGGYRLLSQVEAARLLSDLAMATTASVLASALSLPISVGQIGDS